ncbi:MAG: hypothetical protein P8J32_00400 [bacterium]|nr:hypothetical protein [bacterium]
MFGLKRQLKKLRRQARPSRPFKSTLLKQLSEEFEEVYPAHCHHRRMRFATVGMTSLVVVFMMGTGVYAYESPAVTEGHPLHFLKDGIENVQEGFARTPEERAEFHTRMMERRLEEGERQLPHKPHGVPPTLEEASAHFERVIEVLEQEVEDEELRAQMIEELSIRNARYQHLYSRVVDDGESGELEPLRVHVEGHGFSDDETIRLFEGRRRTR